MAPWRSYMTFALLVLQACSIYGEDSLKSSLTFVIDDTYSMSQEIAQVIQSVDEIFETVWTSKRSQIDNFIVVLFNDDPGMPPNELNEVRVLTNTRDREEFKQALQTVRVHGGDDCPEYSMSGIKLALQNSLPFTTIYVITDASAKDPHLFDEVKKIAQKKQIQVSFLLTGDCGSRNAPDYKVYNNLAKATSGEIIHLMRSDMKTVLDYVKNNIKGRGNALVDVTLPAGYGYKFKYVVDSKTYDVSISVTGLNPQVEVTDSEGKMVKLKYIVQKGEFAVVEIPDAKPDVYEVKVGSASETSLKVLGKTSVNFEHGFSSFLPTSFNDTTTRPVPDGSVYLSMLLHGEGVDLKTAKIIDMNGNVMQELPLRLIDNNTKFYVSEAFDSPKTLFKVSAVGNDEDNKPINRVSATPIEAQTLGDASTKRIAPTVKINGAPKITTDYNNKLKLKCEVNAYPKPNITWLEKDTGITLPTTVSTIEAPYEYASFLYIEKPSRNSTYECRASNPLGESSDHIDVETLTYFNVVEAPPARTYVEYGKEGRIVCEFEANPPATITWYKNGKPLSSDGNILISSDMTTLTIKRMNFELRGPYSCDARNELQNKIFFSMVVLTGLERPSIDKRYTEISTQPGQNALIPCQNTGTPKPVIQWYFRSKNGKIRRILNETDETLLFKSITADDIGTYTCRASNPLGTDIYAVDLILESPPVIIGNTGEVATIYARHGHEMKIPCEVKGLPRPTVHWFKNNRTIKNTRGIRITDGYLKFPSFSNSDSGYYTCKAENKHGFTTKTILVKVHEPVSIDIPLRTSIKTMVGFNVTLSCEAHGNPSPNIKWLYNSGSGRSVPKNLGSSEMTLSLQNIQVKDEGYYTCEASNIGGKKYLTYEVSVYASPKIRNRYRNSTFTISKNDPELQIQCIATGNPKPLISWKKDDLDIAYGSEWYGVEDGTLIIRNIDEKSQGVYECTALNDVGVDYVSYNVILNDAPEITTEYKEKTFTTIKGDSELRIECEASGSPEPVIIWKKDDAEISLGTHYSVEDGTLIIRNIDELSEGSYECLAQNELGTDSEKYNVIVNVPVNIETPIDETIDTMVGQNVELPCRAHGSPQPEIEWMYNSLDHKLNKQLYSDTPSSLNIQRVQMRDQGYYTCTAHNILGSRSITYTVKVNAPPTIENIYSSKKFTVVKGDMALEIACITTGSPKPNISWTKDDTNIEFYGSDRYEIVNGTLKIKTIDELSQGSYKCSATNKLGTAQTEYEVAVLDHPQIPFTVSSQQFIERGTTANVKCVIPHKSVDSLRWYKDGNLIARGELRLKSAKSRDEGIYSCRVNDVMKSRSAHVRVKVGDKPHFTSVEAETIQFVEGDSVRLVCSAGGTPKLKVAWKHNGKSIHEEMFYHYVKMAPDNKGRYTCEVSNDYGTIHRSFNIQSKVCRLNTNEDLLTRNQPLLLKTTLNAWAPFNLSDGYVTMNKNQGFFFYCSNGFTNFPKKIVYATCEGDTQVKIHKNIYAFRDIKCHAEVEPTVQYTDRPCSYGNTEYLNVGYNVFSRFINVYDVCLDKDKNVPLYTRHELSPAQYGVSQNTSNWFKHSLLPFEFDTMYNCDNQMTDISLFQSYDGCCFDRRQLVNPKDLQPGVPTTAAFTYLNVVPHWSTCNSKNWVEVEERVRNLSKTLGKKLTITTGTAEPLRYTVLHDERNAKQPVAKYLWKIVQDESSSIVVIQVNVPGLSPAEADSYLKCYDICDQITWMKGTNWHNTADGYTYCCSVQNFEAGFKYPGLFNDGKYAILSEPFIVDSSYSAS
ncbi:hemicentin-2-like [Anticarsia gemmatalis]|uniref:hemicentin-2-like n=1 Tax=Anticarsia gemmatalis TaxID=129554 RepID=UPI003F75C692